MKPGEPSKLKATWENTHTCLPYVPILLTDGHQQREERVQTSPVRPGVRSSAGSRRRHHELPGDMLDSSSHTLKYTHTRTHTHTHAHTPSAARPGLVLQLVHPSAPGGRINKFRDSCRGAGPLRGPPLPPPPAVVRCGCVLAGRCRWLQGLVSLRLLQRLQLEPV